MIRVFGSKLQQAGKQGEDIAVGYLKGRGFVIVERNVACKYGEIDIIANNGGVTYFFEVKSGREGSPVLPAENLHWKKIQKMRRSAMLYCMQHRVWNRRLQGILILQKRNGAYTVEVIDLV